MSHYFPGENIDNKIVTSSAMLIKREISDESDDVDVKSKIANVKQSVQKQIKVSKFTNLFRFIFGFQAHLEDFCQYLVIRLRMVFCD